MRKLISILFFSVILSLCLLIALALASDNRNFDQRAFNTANNLYMSGNFDEAIQIYENLTTGNHSNSTLYFNLGNAYYRKGDSGRALINYKRALSLNPRDPDIKRNIRMIRTGKIDLINEPESLRGPVDSMANLTANFLSINETAFISLGLWFLIFAMILVYRMSNYRRLRIWVRASLFIFTILFLFVGFSLGSRIISEITSPPAVVTAEEIPLNSQPDEAHKTEYSLKNGTEVFLIDSQGEWVKLSTASNAHVGWVPITSIERITNIIPPLVL